MMLVCSGCSKEQRPAVPQGTNRNVQSNSSDKAPATGGIAAATAVLSTIENLRVTHQNGESHASQNDVVFSEQGRGVAYIAEQNGRQRVVHNGRAGKFYQEISHLRISPDGQHVSYSYTTGELLVMVTDGLESNSFVDVYDAVYSPDSQHVAYLGEGRDKKMRIVLDGKDIEVCQNVVSSNFMFTHDSAKMLYHIRPDREGQDASLITFDLKTGSKTVKQCLDSPIVMNSANDRIAATVAEGDKRVVINFAVDSPDVVGKSGAYDALNNITISEDGKGVAFIGVKGKQGYLVMNGKEDRIPDELMVYDAPVIRPDMKGAGIILGTRDRYNIQYVVFQSELGSGPKTKSYSQVKELVYKKGDNSYAYVAMSRSKAFVVLNGKEGPAFDAVVAPMFSPDGSKLVYRARKGDKRFVVIADTVGSKYRLLPEYEMVFQTVFTSDGKSVAYGVKDGNQLIWKVEKL
jgi:hypothetical protein